MTYKVARYTNSTTIEERPGKFFWRRSAVKVAKDLNAATHKPTGISELFAALSGTPSPWEVYSVKALEYAHVLADEKRWQDQDRAARKKRVADMVTGAQLASVLDDVKAVHPARTLPWLDEDPTDAGTSHDVPEDEWDFANGGFLEIGKELPVRMPGEAMIAQPFLEPEVLTADNDAETAELEKRFQESPIAAQVEEFLADPSADATVKRPACKRPARRLDSIIDDPAL